LTEEAIARQYELARQPLMMIMLAVYSADPSFPAIESGLSKTALYRMLFDNFTKREATKLPEIAQPREQLARLFRRRAGDVQPWPPAHYRRRTGGRSGHTGCGL
jgi:hypothetical protein